VFDEAPLEPTPRRPVERFRLARKLGWIFFELRIARSRSPFPRGTELDDAFRLGWFDACRREVGFEGGAEPGRIFSYNPMRVPVCSVLKIIKHGVQHKEFTREQAIEMIEDLWTLVK
jgi:hypothetical protein